MKHHIKLYIIPLVFLFILPTNTIAAEELGIYENLDKFIPKNLEFTNEHGEKIILNTLIDKPTVINLVYYECPGLCSPLLEGLADVITQAKMDLGTEYQVFTISFDPEETSKLARMKKATYSTLVKGKDVENGWKYFTGNQENINKLLDALGYKVKKQDDEYIHPAAIIVISPKGKITRYLHGTYFLPFDFKMAITEAMDGRSGPTINRFLQYCFSYDAEGKKYVLNFTKISGSMIILLALGLFTSLVVRNKKRKNQKI